MKYKLHIDEANGFAWVVHAEFGNPHPKGGVYEPVPKCKLNSGYNRPWADVKRDAQAVCDLFNKLEV